MIRTEDLAIRLIADQVDDLELARKAIDSRIRSLHIERGGIFSSDDLRVRLLAQAQLIKEAEALAVRDLTRAMRAHPLAGFIRAHRGIGEKTVARLLGIIGDPLWRPDQKTGEMVPRSVAQLRSYCGLGDAAAQRRQRGVKLNYNTKAQVRVHVIADAAIKTRCENCQTAGAKVDESGWIAPAADCVCREDGRTYRAIYDDSRIYEGSRTDEGAAETDGHRHNRALRKVKKAFLRDLWTYARDQVEAPEFEEVLV